MTTGRVSPLRCWSAAEQLVRQHVWRAHPEGTCNENQDSQPFTAPDGTLYVVYNNFNNAVTGNENRNQILIARSNNGGRASASRSRPLTSTTCPTAHLPGHGADPGRACVPEKGSIDNSVFRATNYPIGAVDPTDSETVVVTSARTSTGTRTRTGCTPDGFAADGLNPYIGVKTAAATTTSLYSVSTNGGQAFTGTTTIDPRQLPVVTLARRSRRPPISSGKAHHHAKRHSGRRLLRPPYGDDNKPVTRTSPCPPRMNRVTFAHKRVTSSPTRRRPSSTDSSWGTTSGSTRRTRRRIRSGPTHARWSVPVPGHRNHHHATRRLPGRGGQRHRRQ